MVEKKLVCSCDNDTFGLTISRDELYGRAYISDIADKSSASKLFSSLKSTRNKLRGSYLVEIAGHRIFTEKEAVTALKKLHDAGVSDFPLTFAPEAKLTAAQVRRNTNEANLIAPNTKWKGNELPSVDLKKLLATIAPG